MLLTGRTLEDREIKFEATDVRNVLRVDGKVYWAIWPNGEAYDCIFIDPVTVGQ